MQIVLNSAYAIRETRLQAIATGRIIPGVNDRRSSGLFSGDFSDASSISSTGSGTRFRKLRESTDMARASLDSLRRGSKESLDDLFKRGLSITLGGSNPTDYMDKKRASTGDMMTRSLSQKLNFATNSLAAKVRRSSSVRSVNNAYQQQQEDQIHRDWLLANQLSAAENNTHHHTRQNLISSNASSTTTHTSSLMNRFSQFVSSKPVSPYQPQQQQQKQSSQQELQQQSPSIRRTDSSSTLPPPLSTSAEEKKQLGMHSRENMMSQTAQQVYRGYV
jgi:hypothetical protein